MPLLKTKLKNKCFKVEVYVSALDCTIWGTTKIIDITFIKKLYVNTERRESDLQLALKGS